jgi:hypothetical protein
MRTERVIRISFSVLAAGCVAAAAWLSLRMFEQVRSRPPRPDEVLAEIDRLLPEDTTGLTHCRAEDLTRAADALFGPEGSATRSRHQPILQLLDQVQRVVLVRVWAAPDGADALEKVVFLLRARDGVQAILDAMAARAEGGSLVTRLYAPGRMELQLPGQGVQLTALRGDQIDGVADDILVLGDRVLLDAMPRAEPAAVVPRFRELIRHVPDAPAIWHVGIASETETLGWALWSVRLPGAWRGWVGFPDLRAAGRYQRNLIESGAEPRGLPSRAIADFLLAGDATGTGVRIDEIQPRQDGTGLDFGFLIPVTVRADPPAQSPGTRLRDGEE